MTKQERSEIRSGLTDQPTVREALRMEGNRGSFTKSELADRDFDTAVNRSERAVRAENRKANQDQSRADAKYVDSLNRKEGFDDMPSSGDSITRPIAKGETLLGIANRTGITMSELLKVNPGIKDPNKIFAGRSITIPSKRR